MTSVLLLLALLFQQPASAAPPVPADYQAVLSFLGKQGDFAANVFRINVPRGDLAVTVAGIPTPTAFGFGGWLAMTHGDGGMDVMMGDLVLLQDEVNPVLSALLSNGLEVTAVHNHFFWDEPRVAYMHVHGHGSPMEMAKMIKPALDLIGKGRAAATQAPAPSGTLDTVKIQAAISTAGVQSGPVYKITIGRPDIKLTEMGAAITTRMGLNTWAAFVGTDARSAVAGDIAMLASEVQPVLKALRANDIDVVALHQHMTGTEPTVYFLHYWGVGTAASLASGVKAAISQTGAR
jgi:hypothetical protein